MENSLLGLDSKSEQAEKKLSELEGQFRLISLRSKKEKKRKTSTSSENYRIPPNIPTYIYESSGRRGKRSRKHI